MDEGTQLQELEDIRVKVPPDLHSALKALAESREVEVATLCRELLSESVLGRLHSLKLAARRLKRTWHLGD